MASSVKRPASSLVRLLGAANLSASGGQQLATSLRPFRRLAPMSTISCGGDDGAVDSEHLLITRRQLMLRTATSQHPSTRAYTQQLATERLVKAHNATVPIQDEQDGQQWNINYERRGTGPMALLLMPGALGSGLTDFKRQLERLDRNLFSIIAWDPPGYGASRPPQRYFGDDMFIRDADNAVQFMRKLGFEKFNALGFSDGGITSLIMAARHPRVLERIVVWGANAYVGEQDMSLYELVRDTNQWSAKMRDPLVAMYGEEQFQAMWHQWLDAIAHIKYGPQGGKICVNMLPEIQCPTLIAHGSLDKMAPVSHAYYLKEHIVQSTLHLFPDGAHNIHHKFADEFNAIVSDFLTAPAAVASS